MGTESVESIQAIKVPKLSSSIISEIENDSYGIIPNTSDIDRESRKAQTYRYTQDTGERKLLAHWVICTVSIWLGAVLVITAFSKKWFGLSETVCGILLGTTTLNILGLAFIVLKDLFPKGGNSSDKEKAE